MFGRKRQVAANATELKAPDGIETIVSNNLHSEDEALATLGKLFDVYQPGVIFSEPVTAGNVTVITASEVHVAMGLGFGGGYSGVQDVGGGGGGGGGGASAGRPTAAIIIDSTGVRVEPIIDMTKIVLAIITMLGALFMTWRRMARKR